MNSRIYILIINWNTFSDTVECIQSLYHHVPRDLFRIVLVDNGSENAEGRRLGERYSHIELIQNDLNLGFCGANNQGIQHSLSKPDCEFIMLLNNDTLAIDDFVTPLLTALQQRPRLAVSPIVCSLENPDRIQNAGGSILFGSTVHRSRNRPYVSSAHMTEPTYLVGTCLIATVQVWKDVGLLDDVFFAYCEDADWSLRARERGVNLGVLANSRILHKHSRSTSGSFLKSYYLARNRWRLFSNHYSGWARLWRCFAGTFAQFLSDLARYRTYRFIPSFFKGTIEGIRG